MQYFLFPFMLKDYFNSIKSKKRDQVLVRQCSYIKEDFVKMPKQCFSSLLQKS